MYLGQHAPKLGDLFLVKNKRDESFRLADKIPIEWENIGSNLGIGNGVLQGIDLDNPGQSIKKLRKVLNMWVENAGGLPKSKRYPHSWKGLRNILVDIGKKECRFVFQILRRSIKVDIDL